MTDEKPKGETLGDTPATPLEKSGKKKPSSSSGKSGQDGLSREERLAEALRANLRRRKSAAKARRED